LPLLKLALLRIKCPESLTNLIINIFKYRANQVITNLEKSQSYLVQDGIDQGETISPILWRIYYDPLISLISNSYKGYILACKDPSTTIFLTTNISCIAYMDDTTWVAQSKEELKQILCTAASFYTLTNIKVN